MIKFTIVTITYNAQDVVGVTLDSVLSQSYSHIEHIIVDGASTDNTLSIISDYQRRSEELSSGHIIKVTSEKDKGLYDAMNKGLERATGDYICFLNAGDSLHDADVIENIIIGAKIDDTPSTEWPAVIYGDTDIVNGDRQFLHHRRLSPPEHLTWRSFVHGMLVCHQAFYARRDIAQSIHYDLSYRYSADVDWCIRVMKAADKRRLSLVYVKRVFVDYLEEGQTTLHHRDSLKERYNVMVVHYGRIVTMTMHLWFAVRNSINIIKKRLK